MRVTLCVKSGAIRLDFFFLSLNLLIGWQLSIWNYFKPFFSFLFNCQLQCFWRLAFKYRSQGLPTAFFPDIAPSRMFTTNSLCPIVCPIHEWRLFGKMFKSNLSSFALEKLNHSLFYLSILFLTFLSSFLFYVCGSVRHVSIVPTIQQDATSK